jgi:hypothetical protein
MVAPGSWEDATIEWNKRVETDSDSEVTVRAVPSSELAFEEEGRHAESHSQQPALAALLHPSAPIVVGKQPIVAPSPRHRSTSLAKTLATKALANAHRRSKDKVDAMNDISDPSYAVVNALVTSTPFAETVVDSPHQSRVDAGMQDSSLPWTAEAPLSIPNLPARMPEPGLPANSAPQKSPAHMSMPEPTIPSTVQKQAPFSMPEPQLKMPEPQLDTLRSPPAMPNTVQSIPLPALSQAAAPMSMPEPAIPIHSPPPNTMPEPQLPGTAFIGSTPLTTKAAHLPESTYDPSSLQPPQWTDTRTPALTTLAGDDETLLARMKTTLEQLPQSLKASLPKEELIRMVLDRVEGQQHEDSVEQPQAQVQDASWLPFDAAYPYQHVYLGQEVYEVPNQQPWPEYTAVQETPPISASDWFQMNGSGMLPTGECHDSR